MIMILWPVVHVFSFAMSVVAQVAVLVVLKNQFNPKAQKMLICAGIKECVCSELDDY